MVRDQVVARVVESEDQGLSPWLRSTGFPPHGAANPRRLSLNQLEELCDDPARDLPGGSNVRAVLTLEPEEGFYLSAQDGDRVYLITDENGRRTRFRTIEIALATLQNLSGLSPDIGLLQVAPGRGIY